MMNWCMIWTAIILLLHVTLCSAGDPCPPASQLGFCKCSRKNHETYAPEAHGPQHGYREADLFDELYTNDSMEMESQSIENDTELVVEFRRQPVVNSIDPMLTVVECNVNRNSVTLEQIAIGLHRKSIDKLTVAHVLPRIEEGLVSLPAGWLKNTRVKQIEILHSALSGDFIWTGNPFEGQEKSLVVLKVNYCSLKGALTYDVIGTVNTKSMDQFPSIEVLDLSRNNLVIVTTSAFHKPPANLSTINLSYNNIRILESGAFKAVHSLKSLDLSHNLLEEVARNILAAPAKLLETINLSWNFIKELPTDFFANMPSLRRVDMERNYLYTLSEKPWVAVWKQLSLVDVAGNYIECDCSLLWLFGRSGTANMARKSVNGTCIFHRIQPFDAIEYSLQSLNRKQLMCNRK